MKVTIRFPKAPHREPCALWPLTDRETVIIFAGFAVAFVVIVVVVWFA